MITTETEIEGEKAKEIVDGLIELFLHLNKDAIVTGEMQRSCDVSFEVADKIEVKAHVVFDICGIEKE